MVFTDKVNPLKHLWELACQRWRLTGQLIHSLEHGIEAIAARWR
jgi:hypothetical protein